MYKKVILFRAFFVFMIEPDAPREEHDLEGGSAESGMTPIGRFCESGVHQARALLVKRFAKLLGDLEAQGNPHPHFEAQAHYDQDEGVVLRHRKDGRVSIPFGRFRSGFRRVLDRLISRELLKLKQILDTYGPTPHS